MESTPNNGSADRYSVEEVAGTLFLKHGNLVLATNIGEQFMVSETVREHFAAIVKTMNEKLDSGPGLEDSGGSDGEKTDP